MKILLINNNPVVSRLTALSARKEDIEIDEIQEVTELSADKYDIVFVDADSWSKDVQDVISENINVQKRVLFYAQDDKENRDAFDMSILKPFLPSEVSAVIRNLEESQSAVTQEEDHFDLLEESKEEKKDTLFELEEEATPMPELVPMDLDVAKKKDDLLDELEKVDLEEVSNNDTFDKKLEEAFPAVSSELEDDLFEKNSNDIKIESSDFASKTEDDLFELDLNDELLSDEPKVEKVLANDKDDVLDFDTEKTEEVDFVTEVEKSTSVVEESLKMDEDKTIGKEETKVLDKEEVANIKEILHGEKEETMQLEDLVVPTIPAMALTAQENLDVEKKKKNKKEKSDKDEKIDTAEMAIDSDVAVRTLTSLPIESLRELLAGARININIKFPKAK